MRWPIVLFDLDGTLCNTVDLILASFHHAHREVLGQELDEAVALGWIGRTLRDIYAPYEQAAQLEASYLRFNLANLERLQTGYDGIRELLTDLKAQGIRTGVVTSKRHEGAARSLAAAGLDQLIPVVCAMEDTGQHKPNPQPLLLAMEKLGVHDSSHGAYVGDATVDVQAAHAAGLASLAVTWGAGTRDELAAQAPLALCTTVDELRGHLLG